MSVTELEDDEMYSRPGVFPGSRRALVISNKALDDGDFRSSVSSRKDQMLLSDITAKLVSMHFRRWCIQFSSWELEIFVFRKCNWIDSYDAMYWYNSDTWMKYYYYYFENM